MEYNYKLLTAEVIEVCNNLIIDAKLEDSQQVAAFCGAVEVAKMCKPGMRLLLKRTSNSKRLVKYNVAFIETESGIVFANPKYNRQLFQEAFENNVLDDFAEYNTCIPLNINDNVSGIDFELRSDDGKKCFVFVTSLYEKQEGYAVFPQAINFFEMKILEEMKKHQKNGDDVCIFMIVPRDDCISAKFVWNLNALAAASTFEAAKNGIKFLCYGCNVAKNHIEISRKMEILY